MLKKFLLVLTAISVLGANIFLFACDTKEETPPQIKSQIVTYDAPVGSDSFDEVKIFAGDKEIFVYQTMINTSQTWNAQAPMRKEAGFAYFDFEGYADIKIEFSQNITSAVIRPLDYGIQTNISNNILTFKITVQADYVIEPNGDAKNAIHLFCNKIEENLPDSQDENVIYFCAGIHTSQNNPYISSDNKVTVPSGKTVYIAGGAIVKAGFIAASASNIRITGRGIIDGSDFERNVATYKTTIPLEFNNCQNVTLEDFIISDPAGWCVQFYFVDSGTIDGIKMISSRSNGDGISLQSTQNIEVKNCFVRTWDDSLVVKNYPVWSNRSIHGITRNIDFSYCVLWTDLAQSMEIGYETVGEIMEDIIFENITVLHNFHKPVMSIHNGNNAKIKNVVFKNITVEDAMMGGGDAGGNCELIDIKVRHSSNWSDQHTVTPLGEVDGILFQNIKVVSGRSDKYIPITMFGDIDTRTGYNNSEHWVKNVTVEDITIINKNIKSTYDYIFTNQFTENIEFVHSGIAATGAALQQ